MFALCVESSHARGMGHLFRSLTLADALRAANHDVQFLINDSPVALAILTSRGYSAEIVDLADTKSNWEKASIDRFRFCIWIDDRLDTLREHAENVRASGIPLVTFDDRGEGAALADLNVAALVFDGFETLMGRRVVHGVDWLILNPEIARYRRLRRNASPILVTLGGSDTYGATVRVVEALARKGRGGTIVIGPNFEHHTALREVLTPDFTVKSSLPSLAEEMSHYGLAITGGGVTPFEANAAGLPCIVIANELFEIPVGNALEKMGGAVFAGHHATFDVSVFDLNLPIEEMSRAAMRSVKLDGVQNVREAIESLW
jgi:spore coat polysaccharide biosynthesis predicted glycosyltransferase SpsG